MKTVVTVPCPICRAKIELPLQPTECRSEINIDTSALHAHIATHMNPDGGGEEVAA